MLYDEENLVKLEAYQQLSSIILDFEEEDLDASEICKIMHDIYNEQAYD